MKRIYIALLILLFLLIFAVFNFNRIVNLSIPFVKKDIQNQLNIVESADDNFNIEVDFDKKIIVLEIQDPVFVSGDNVESGSAKLIIIEKDFMNIFNENIRKIVVQNLNLRVRNKNKKIFNISNDFSFNFILRGLKKTKRFDEIIISKSKLDISSILEGHFIEVEQISIHEGIIESKGSINIDGIYSKFNIYNSESGNFININLNLNSYSPKYLSNYLNNSLSEILFQSTYKGEINFKFDEYFKHVSAVYDLSSLNGNITAGGEYTSKNNVHNSTIVINNIILNNYEKDFKLLKYLKSKEFGDFNIEINTVKNFKDFNFNLSNTEGNIIAYGRFKNKLLYALSSQGQGISLSYLLDIFNLKLDAIPKTLYDKLVHENYLSYNFDYKSTESNIKLEAFDNYENKLNAIYDYKKNFVNELEIVFFYKEENSLKWNNKNSTFAVNIDKTFYNYLNKNFQINILHEFGLQYIDDFKIINILGKISNDSFSNNNLFVNNLSVFLEHAKLNFSKFRPLSNFINTQGFIDINYDKDNIKKTNKVSIDFKESEISIEKLNYFKTLDQPLKLSFDYKQDKNIVVTNFDLGGSGLSILGKLSLSDSGIDNIFFNSFKIGQSDVSFKFDSDDDANEYTVVIEGKKLDISFLDIKESKSLLSNIKINLIIDVDDLYYINKINFVKVKLDGVFHKVWQELKFSGSYDTGGDLNIVLKPQENIRIFKILSSDSGKTLKIKKISKSITGGKLIFSGKYKSDKNDNEFDADLKLEDFAIKKKSKLAGFLKVIRIFDIKQQIKGDTEDFEYAEMKIYKRNKVYEITDGKAYGGLMALTLNGTIDKTHDSVKIEGLVAPTHAIDSWVGKIPIIGNILTGTEGGGVVAANYSVKGTVKNPKYFVNPLSILTPGIFKEFWKIFDLPQTKKIN